MPTSGKAYPHNLNARLKLRENHRVKFAAATLVAHSIERLERAPIWRARTVPCQDRSRRRRWPKASLCRGTRPRSALRASMQAWWGRKNEHTPQKRFWPTFSAWCATSKVFKRSRVLRAKRSNLVTTSTSPACLHAWERPALAGRRERDDLIDLTM